MRNKMSRSGKFRLNCFRPSTSSPASRRPNSFLCPISGSLMADPVIIPTGHTFERACIQACKDLIFIPPVLSSTSLMDLLSFVLIPNLALKSVILEWCDQVHQPHPLPVSEAAARGFVEKMKAEFSKSRIPDRPKTEPSSSHASSPNDGAAVLELENKITQNLPEFTTKEALTGSLIQLSHTFAGNNDRLDREVSSSDKETKEQILKCLKECDISENKLGLQSLIRVITECNARRISFCNMEIMKALNPKLWSSDDSIQFIATEVILVFTNEESNKSRIIRWGAVEGLVYVLDKGVLEARANAAAAIYNLACNTETNSMIIGSFGAIMPLVQNFCIDRQNHELRKHAGSALDSLTTGSHNLEILEMSELAPLLQAITTKKEENGELRILAMRIMSNLAITSKGSEALMDVGVVEKMLRMMREGERMDKECLAVMHKICMHCPERFRETAMPVSVLAKEKEEWGDDGINMARQMLELVLQEIGRGKGKGKEKESYHDPSQLTISSRVQNKPLSSTSTSASKVSDSAKKIMEYLENIEVDSDEKSKVKHFKPGLSEIKEVDEDKE